MKTFKEILCLLFSFCVLQLSICVVQCAIAAGANSSKSSFAKTDDKGETVSSSLLGSIYHKSRQSRCVTCYEDRRYGEDRSRYYSGYASRSGEDRARSWYYPSYDRYDDRGYRGAEYDRYATPGADRYEADRYGADRYGTDRYGTADRYTGYRDDPYGSRSSYDRYDSRTRDQYDRIPAYDRGESRGYGYDNRDRYYGGDRGISNYYGRDRYYERPRYGNTGGAGSSAGYGGYDRDYYDRYSPRGQSGYDNDYYYPKGSQGERDYLSESGYKSPVTRCGIRKPNCPYNPPEEGTRVTSGPINSGHYNVGVSQTAYNTNSYRNQNESAKGWSYMREDEQTSKGGSNSGSYASNSNSDKQSSGYGALLDRGSNLIAVEPVKSNDNANDSMASSDTQKDKNVDETPKQNENGENS